MTAPAPRPLTVAQQIACDEEQWMAEHYQVRLRYTFDKTMRLENISMSTPLASHSPAAWPWCGR